MLEFYVMNRSCMTFIGCSNKHHEVILKYNKVNKRTKLIRTTIKVWTGLKQRYWLRVWMFWSRSPANAHEDHIWNNL